MISQGEVEMSLISKNFFFTFFNLFVVFTIFGTASNATAARYRDTLGDSLKNTTSIAYTLANSLKDLVLLYINLIILQGLGLFPLRLLEFGSVALYPINLIGAKTPRGTQFRQESHDFFMRKADSCSRLRRACAATSIQLWILSSSEPLNLHHLHRLQRLASLMVRSILWANILYHRQFHIQVSTSLRHGS